MAKKEETMKESKTNFEKLKAHVKIVCYLPKKR